MGTIALSSPFCAVLNLNSFSLKERKVFVRLYFESLLPNASMPKNGLFTESGKIVTEES